MKHKKYKFHEEKLSKKRRKKIARIGEKQDKIGKRIKLKVFIKESFKIHRSGSSLQPLRFIHFGQFFKVLFTFQKGLRLVNV